MRWRNLDRTYADRIAVLREQLTRDPYAILGLDSSASNKEVKRAYRLAVSSYHPDRQSAFLRVHSEEVLKVINSAYEQICALRHI